MLEIKGYKGGQAPYRPQGKSKSFWRTLRNITLFVVIVLALLIGAAVAYAWYTGKHAGGDIAVTETIKSKPALKKPIKPKPDAQIGVATQYVTNPVAPGENASISIHTNADAKCTITVDYDKTVAKDSGLKPKVADDYGLVEWSWTIPENAPLGKKTTVDVRCANEKKNARKLEHLVIEHPKS